MSKRSGKSELSPSITKTGGSGIDLRKNEAGGVDMGRKIQPSVSSSGVGLTQEIGNIGGIGVTGGVSVDISPIDFNISGHPSFEDPNQNAVSIAGGAEVPGGLLGISGGLTINTSTGEIEAVSIGGEAGGFGITLSASEGGVGVEFSYQIGFIELSIGFGSLPRRPGPTSTTDPILPPPKLPKPIYPPGDPNKFCRILFAPMYDYWEYLEFYETYTITRFTYQETGRWENDERGQKTFSSRTGEYTINGYNDPKAQNIKKSLNKDEREVFGRQFTDTFGSITSSYQDRDGNAANLISITGSEQYIYQTIPKFFQDRDEWIVRPTWRRIIQLTYHVVARDCSPSDTIPPPDPPRFNSPPPPPPAPPPRKQKMDQCCRESIMLGRQNRRYLQEVMIMMGRPLDAKGNLIAIPKNAKFFGEPVERIKTPIKDINNPEKETIQFGNYYQLLMYGLRQQINLDVGIDPQSFVAPTGKVQNPAYQRDSEESLESNEQPEEDKAGNKRELELGEDFKINSLAQQQQYLFEALRRLEYLFPSGELADANFDKSLIIPGAKGELKIHNLIHFKEFLVQFLNATLGNPKIPIKIEDTNELKEGKQEATFNHFSISHMIRELYKITLESGDDINSLMETAIRNFRTNLANRIQIIQIAEMAQALVQDTGMLEDQVFIPVKLDGDPYAGKWKEGVGFEPDADLDSNTEEATEKLMKATLNNFEAQVKVIRRDERENADIRDLLVQVAEMFTRTSAIPATKEGIEKALEAARFKVKVDNALSRSQVKRAAAAKLSRTKKRKK